MMAKGKNSGPCPVAVAKTSKTLVFWQVLATRRQTVDRIMTDLIEKRCRVSLKMIETLAICDTIGQLRRLGKLPGVGGRLSGYVD